MSARTNVPTHAGATHLDESHAVVNQQAFIDNRTSTGVQLQQQRIMANSPRATQLKSMQGSVTQTMQRLVAKPNQTGMPDNLKNGIESLSGISMDAVRVHYNSSKPAQLNAHAYAQGTDIHIAPGQEQHLPHEAWHVVQQAQGRVKPTMQMKAGVPVNDDAGLEHEADVMGAMAMQVQHAPIQAKLLAPLNHHSAIQLQTTVKWTSQSFRYKDETSKTIKTKEVGGTMEAKLDPAKPIQGADAQSSFQKDMYDSLKHYWNPGAKHWVRGHLLNANLGGPNVAPNLFPITGHANGDHLNYVENHVKQWVIDGRPVTYRITATQAGGDVAVGSETDVPNAAGHFECYAETTDDKEKKVLHRLVQSIPVKRDAPGGSSDAPGHASKWMKNETDDKQTDKAPLLLNSDQINFLQFLIDNNGNMSLAIRNVSISLDDWSILNDAINDALNSTDNENSAEQSADTETEKVGHKVTNAKLKAWLGASLNNTAAEEWLTNHKKSDNNYETSST